jgi:hypothetical protein
MRNFTAPRTCQIWTLNGKDVKIFTQESAPDGSNNVVSMVYIDWSPKLVMVHNADLTPEQAATVAENVRNSGVIDLTYWTKFQPNDAHRVDAQGNPAPIVNPYMPGFRPMNFDHEAEQ